jgi:hypothetical protein
MDRNSGLVARTSTSGAKVDLFRSLFRGRDDVYPRRFESRTSGKSGYAPACANWKRDYSGSVRRLVRDGVDAPLASLFVHVARPVPPDADGADRAWSATEAFLYRRLENLAETKGRFGVNVALPIVVDGAGSLEVDLLCADARVAVELDGAQHLADAVAYRRKDRLLQENGYFVLRFLAEDVGKELDMVLDTISSALSRAARK